MKVFLKKILFFSLLLFILISIRFIFLPYYFGNDIYASKIKQFEYSPKTYNTVIFGSSRLYRQINPTLLDSILNKTKTYNFATPATYYPESLYLYESFIDNLETNKINYAFVEIQHLELFKNNAKTLRGNYWNTLPSLLKCLDFINNSHYSDNKKHRLKQTYYYSFINRIIDFSSINKILNSNKVNTGVNGFYSLEKEMSDKTENFNDLLKRNNLIKSDTIILNNLVQSAIKLDSIQLIKSNLNLAYFNELTRLIKKSKVKGIKLIYILPPRLNLEYYKELIPVCEKLPQSNIINLASYKLYKNLYDKKYSFDFDHLNDKGSEIFTKLIAYRTLNILEDFTVNE
ncbi:hypothetical protein [Xanthomarina sp. GH4-25]|uniref:hypothetical protein n=1 Tax=Xanthomarina sp. GH4-25 TaxID=3349335 RepID=UPI003877D5E8